MSDGFYRAFEEKHRGSRELIKSRLRVYLPFVEPLKECFTERFAVDLGCGRGEWLELMKESGLDAQGVDLDDAMLAACRERGLNVQTEDAVGFLKGLSDDSHIIISGFHIAEHIPFSELQVLVQEALRVLKPGGLLILETPNPENIVVGTTNFYLDPTHQRPIPPLLLSFLPEHYGFERVKVLRLQEPEDFASGWKPTLLNVLDSVSPDYAVVAQKAGSSEMMNATTPAFAVEYGLTLDSIAGRYDNQAEERAANIEAKAQQAEAKAQQAEAHFMQAEAMLNALYNSRSWRITAPFRWVGKIMRWFIRGGVAWLTFAPMSRPRRIVRKSVIHLKNYFSTRPRLKALALRWLALFPSLKTRLKQVGSQPQPASYHFAVEGPEQLSPRARQIYADLQSAVANNQKEHG